MEDWFARPSKTPISPSELNPEGKGQALVLRYAGCQLRQSECPLCYASRYAWNIKNGHVYNVNEVLNSLGNLKNLPALGSKKIVWVRIQGGEPLLNYDRILTNLKYSERAVREIHCSGLNYYSTTRVVIQTNMLIFDGLNGDKINEIKNHLQGASHEITGWGRIIFEASFKSSNNPAILHRQVRAYEVLLNKILFQLWEKGTDNVAVYPIAGLGPSIDRHNVWLIPIEPKELPYEIPLFHSSCWSSSFKNLINDFVKNVMPKYKTYDDFRKNPKTNNGTKLAIEELEPTKFQSAWISRYVNQAAQPPIDILLRRIDSNPNSQWVSLVLFGKNQNWLRVVNAIPIASNPAQLLEHVEKMNEYFYPSHPIGHYPHL